MMLPPKAYIFIGLNVIRALTMIALILVFASNILTMVDDVKAVNAFQAAVNSSNSTDSMLDCDYIEDSTVPNQPAGVFWAVVNRLMIIFQVVILFLSEAGWPYKFFDKFFPVLGTNFGLGATGLFQCFIGAAVLSHHVDDFALVSAFFLVSLGCINILVGLIFREKGKEKRSILSWRAEKKKGLLPFVKDAAISQAPAPLRPFLTAATSKPPSFVSHLSDEKAAFDEKHGYGVSEFGHGRGFGWGRAGEKFAAGKGLLISKPVEALPPYGPGARIPPSISRPTAAATVEDAPEDDESIHEHHQRRQPHFRSTSEAL